MRKAATAGTNSYRHLPAYWRGNGKELQDELGQYDYSYVFIAFSGIHELGRASVTGQGSMTR